jgi:serine phosphatase RsbU (regulator of sigma subunit)
MLDSETIAQHNSLLETYRRTLAHLLQQAAQYGGEVFAPSSMGQGQPLGILPNPDLNQGTITIPHGGTLLYTDGVTEALDMHGSFFEADRLYKMARANRETSAQELCERLLQAVTQYRGAALQADDVTLVAVRAQ